jgi:glutathione S-transferase
MIKLIQFPAAFGLPNLSPFCIKVEMLLKMAGLDYETIVTGNPSRGPKGKLPAIEDDGALIGDSEAIRRHLERKYRIDFDAGLDDKARAIAHAFARMLEERTYWVGVYSRWIDARFWPQMRATAFGSLPPVIRGVAATLVRRQIRRALHGQGVGRHAPAEIYVLGQADIDAVAAQLGEQPYFMGSAPSSVDATVFAFTASILVPSLASPLKEAMQRHANLVAYVERMQARYFGAGQASGTRGSAMLHTGA